jgi:aminopeptidase-like protein
MALLWVLNLADGRHSLLDMAERAGLPFAVIRAAADVLTAADLLYPTPVER